jgi:hypothetical protein
MPPADCGPTYRKLLIDENRSMIAGYRTDLRLESAKMSLSNALLMSYELRAFGCDEIESGMMIFQYSVFLLLCVKLKK